MFSLWTFHLVKLLYLITIILHTIIMLYKNRNTWLLYKLTNDITLTEIFNCQSFGANIIDCYFV
jgi:hypothetical protein